VTDQFTHWEKLGTVGRNQPHETSEVTQHRSCKYSDRPFVICFATCRL